MVKKQARIEESRPPRKFGMFYPRGYVIVSFDNEADGQRVRRALLDGGYEDRTFNSWIHKGSWRDPAPTCKI